MGAYKNVLQRYHFVDTVSMGASATSGTLDISNLDNIGLQVIWTGTPTGTFSVDVSTDNGTTWTSLTFTPSLAAPAGSGSNTYIDLNQLSAPSLRFTYTRVSGTGTLDVWASGKSV